MSQFSPVSSTSEFEHPVEVFVARPPRQRTWIYVVAFLLTVLTTLVVGARLELNFQHDLPMFSDELLSLTTQWPWALGHASHLALGVPFSATLLVILFAHEMGHYLFCRYYLVEATLPFFVPFPSLIGTLGAFIRIKSPIRSRSALFDIGIAGPIAGFVVAGAVLVVGVTLSKPMPLVTLPTSVELGYPPIFRIAHYLLQGPGATPLARMNLHPIAVAAWVGIFATALNLLPGGQLDGGHILFSLSPHGHRIISSLSILILIALGYYQWIGWFVWAVLLGLSGMRHPMVPAWPGITGARRWVALLGLLMLLLSFTPAPILHLSVREW